MKYLSVWLVAFSCLFLTSCLNIIEEIKINKDGSGSYQLTFDLNGLYHVASFDAIMQDLNWSEAYGMQSNFRNLDTIIPFSALIAENRGAFERPEFWDKVFMHTRLSVDQNILAFDIKMDFERLEDIDYFYKDFTKIQAISDSPEAVGMNTLEPLKLMEGRLFELEKNTLIRNPMKLGSEQIDQDQMQFLKQFIPNATYKTIYHLPGKVKKNTIKNSMVSDHLLTAEYPLLDIYEGETQLNGEIRFK